jgi:hypothetical protein
MLGRRPKAQALVAVAPAIQAPPALPPAVEQAARVEIELSDAREDLAGAEAEVVASKAAYEQALDAARLSEAVAAKARVLEAEVLVDIGRRLCARLEVELAELLQGAADVAAAAERAQLRDVAETAMADYARAFRTEMPALTAGLRGLIRKWAVAELAREAAVTKGVSLPRVDGFRDVEGAPRVQVSRRVLDLWINEFGGQPFSDSDQKLIKTDSDGAGVLQGENHVHRPTRKRRFDEVIFRPGSPGKLAPALSEALVLPCLDAVSPAGWSPLKRGTRPQDVLAALDALEAQSSAPQPEPELRTERRAVEQPRDVRPKHKPKGFLSYLRQAPAAGEASAGVELREDA